MRKAQQTAVNRGKQIGVATNDERNTAQLSTNSSIGWLPLHNEKTQNCGSKYQFKFIVSRPHAQSRPVALFRPSV